MGREDPQLKLRMPEEMKALITDEARVNGRSVNSEILYRLQRTLDEPALPDDIISRLREYSAEVKIPVRNLMIKAVTEFIPHGYSIGEFIEKWAIPAAHANTNEARERIIKAASEDRKSAAAGLYLTLRQPPDEIAEIQVRKMYNGGDVIAVLPTYDRVE